MTAQACQECAETRGCVAAAMRLLDDAPVNPLMLRERRRVMLVGEALARAARARAGEQTPPAPAARSQRIGLTPEQEQELQRLAPRVASQVRSLWQQNWFAFARHEMLQGRNPAPKGWKRAFCLLLIGGGCTQLELQHALQREGMTEGSARSQASVATAVFHAGRIITHQNGRYVISPN